MEQAATAPAGVIGIKEDKNTVKGFRNWYQTKIVDTGKSQKFENKMTKDVDRQVKIIAVAGAGATALLAVCPADGPFGEACAIVATPLLMAAAKLKAKFVRDFVIPAKRWVEEKVFKVDISSLDELKDKRTTKQKAKDIAPDFKKVVDIASKMKDEPKFKGKSKAA